MRGLATAVAAVVGLCLMAAPASAAEAPISFAKTDPLETTCTNLKAEGVEVKVHNETGREREVKLTLGEFLGKDEAVVADGAVCGGLSIAPGRVMLAGDGRATFTLTAGKAREGNFSGSVGVSAETGRTARREVKISSGPAPAPTALQATPLVPSQTVELEGSEHGPFWIPVEGALSKLPKKPKDPLTLGAISGPQGDPVAVIYAGGKRLTATTSQVGLEFDSDELDPGTYSGEVDLSPQDDEAGTASLSVKAAASVGCAIAVIAAGILLGLLLQWAASVLLPRYRLWNRINSLSTRNTEAAGKLPQGKGWGKFAIGDIDPQKMTLKAQLKKWVRLNRTAIDKPVLDDMEARIATVEKQIDLLEELPDHAGDLETALENLPAIPPERLPGLKDTDAGRSKPQLDTEARKSLVGEEVDAKDLKAHLEEIDARAKQVRTMQGQEERLADLWEARRTLAGLSEAKLVELDTELDSMRHLLWNAESAEDLESVADDLQAAAKLVGRLWHELPEDAPPLPFDISRYRSTSVDVATAYAAHFPSGTIVIGGGPGFEPEVTIGAEPVPSTPVSDGPPPPTLPPSPPGPVLSEAATDRRAERAWLVQLVIVIVTALVVLGAGLGALYAGKTWGTRWDYIAALIWGLGLQATALGLASSLDSLATLRPRR